MTPHLVGLARNLEGEAFHFVAQHCQKDTRENVVAYVRSKGLAPDTPNVTVTSFGRHPKVKGNGYVPYSMVFDHHGDLVYHHMSGDYHGGDGLEVLEVVRRYVSVVPEVYLGKAPFERFAELAARVEEGRDLGRLEAEILEARAEALDAAEEAELDRMTAGLTRLYEREVDHLRTTLVHGPAEFPKVLGKLEKRFAKTSYVERLNALSAELEPLVKPSMKVARSLAKVEKKLAKLPPSDACDRAGMESHQLGCPRCTKANAKKLVKLRADLDALVESAGDLPIGKRVATLRESLAG